MLVVGRALNFHSVGVNQDWILLRVTKELHLLHSVLRSQVAYIERDLRLELICLLLVLGLDRECNVASIREIKLDALILLAFAFRLNWHIDDLVKGVCVLFVTKQVVDEPTLQLIAFKVLRNLRLILIGKDRGALDYHLLRGHVSEVYNFRGFLVDRGNERVKVKKKHLKQSQLLNISLLGHGVQDFTKNAALYDSVPAA